ncbi:WecB/TagA/CpsF family glycosyltransferase [Glaciecola petra]|uniref:WecB/TagA/CpsF family glycosyltransferase n=1 Tax=Glaciecola petra TaxID=3075602 RepID=A0ABU2ZTH3_9ALTE|nr:WecB/TagA/CpsF family glycosyltransferase [Aestuariibacter sp. P117]MDT0595949.1 WecB/TagA/CpsF family glycosyltransferase [Aestuariibacter sp. P117]
MKKIKTKLVELHDLNLEESLDWVIDNSENNKFKYVVTPNIDHLERLVKNREGFSYLYEQADLCLCDSRILKVLLSIKSTPIDSVVPGSDLTAMLFDSPKLSNKKVLIFGGDDAIFKQLQDTHERLDLTHINPSMGFINKPEEVKELVASIKSLKPDVLFLAVGSPQQEKFAIALKQELEHGVALCIGASILFITGEEKRAPIIFQKLHLEWFFRMIVAPRLIKRYWQNFLSLRLIYKSL